LDTSVLELPDGFIRFGYVIDGYDGEEHNGKYWVNMGR
jgi:hypothetical protein